MSRVGGVPPTLLITEEVFEELEEAKKRSGISTDAQACRLFLERGVHHAYPESVGGLLGAGR